MNDIITTVAPVKPLKGPLSDDERRHLAELEPIIERGLANFIEVGNALLEVSDQRLYRETHSTFKEYVENKWKISVRQAYRLCESAEVVECVQLVTTESQARELANVPVTERPKVLKAAADRGPVTAKAIKLEVEKAKAQPRFRCNSCEEEFEDDNESQPLYECGECGNQFTPEQSEDGSHRCSDCNKFCSKISDLGCPDCGAGQLEEIESEAIDVHNSSSFAEEHKATMSRLAAIGARLKLEDLTLDECAGLMREAQSLTSMWTVAALECERELGKVFIQAEAAGFKKEEILAEVNREVAA